MKRPGNIYDIGIAWNWQYDEIFIKELNEAVLKRKLRPYLVGIYNLDETINLLNNNKLKFRFFLDRASDTDGNFLRLNEAILQKSTYFINHPAKIKQATDKIHMHNFLSQQGINVPKTFVFYPTESVNTLHLKLKDIGMPFVMKPAESEGGGVGVLINASSADEALKWHQRYNKYVFLLQQRIDPMYLDGHMCWFRIFYCFGKVIPCWWDDYTHIYEVISKEDIKRLKLEQIVRIAAKVGKLTKLDLFSTEITLSNKGKFFVVDYVNDQCDMRRKSKYKDGVCDEIVDEIIRTFALKVAR